MRPMLASPGTPPEGEQWLYEVKWDGMRVIAEIRGGHARLFSRTGRDISTAFPELLSPASSVSDAILDGEIIALRAGVPSFAALAERMHVEDARQAAVLADALPVAVMTFDLLRLHDVDLMNRPLTERRTGLASLELSSRWRLSPDYDDGVALFAATREQGLEGVVAKRRGSTYQPGRRSGDWVKTPHRKHQSCVVAGWRPESGDRSKIGALLLGVPDENGNLRFAGRVGSGIGQRASVRLAGALAARPTPPFDDEVPQLDATGAHWCEPEVVVEVRHLGWTGGGRLRQPVYLGIRDDLRPAGVRREG
ncbi:hypothetical protein BH10ACT8_BH10ACT8_16800 [soil metagenome]